MRSLSLKARLCAGADCVANECDAHPLSWGSHPDATDKDTATQADAMYTTIDPKLRRADEADDNTEYKPNGHMPTRAIILEEAARRAARRMATKGTRRGEAVSPVALARPNGKPIALARESLSVTG